MHVLIGEYLRSIDLRCNDYAKTYHQKYYMTPECTVVYREKLLDLIKKLVNDFNFDLNSTDYV
ncbi:MAG: hypothetical protein HRU35_01625 [Rickettsiaceae bacterium]|nr:hypothetical protein [Rickettsiaceae bacterium]